MIRPLDCAKIFPQAVFLRIAMEWLLGDEDVWSVELQYRLKRAIPFDPTIGSCSNFYRGFFLRVGMEWLLGDKDVWSVVHEYRLKRAIPFDPTVELSSNFYKGCFP